MQRLARTGAVYTRNTGTDPREIDYVNLVGTNIGINLIAAAGGGTSRQLSSGSEIILSSAPMDVISIANGRWSDPLTWDIGDVPAANDNVHVRHVVYTGIDAQVFGASRAWTVAERQGSLAGDLGAAANRIIVEHDPVAPSNPTALVIGNSSLAMAGGEYLFRTRLVDGLKNYIQNDVTGVSADGEGTSATGMAGIWVRTVGTGANGFTPVLGTYQMNNAGTINNNSIIEVGVCAP